MKRIFKGLIVCILVLFIGYLIWEKSFPTVFQTAMGVTKWQSKKIENLLKEKLLFVCDKVEKADMSNPLLRNMDERYRAFVASNQSGEEYILIIEKKNAELDCVFRSEDMSLAFGLVDNVMLPAYFSEEIP